MHSCRRVCGGVASLNADISAEPNRPGAGDCSIYFFSKENHIKKTFKMCILNLLIWTLKSLECKLGYENVEKIFTVASMLV